MAGMGELTTQQRQLLVAALKRLHAAWKQAIADGPVRGERVMVTVGENEILARGTHKCWLLSDYMYFVR